MTTHETSGKSATPKLAEDLKEVVEHVGETIIEKVEEVEAELVEAADSLGSRSRQFVIAIGAGMALIAGGTWWALRRRRAPRRIWRARGLALQRMWRHPELVGHPTQPTVLAKAGRNLAAAAITTAVKRGADRLLQKAWPE